MRNEKLTIMDLPKTRKQIEENNRLCNRIERSWRNFLNEFFQPEQELTKREANIAGLGVFAVFMTVMFMLLWV